MEIFWGNSMITDIHYKLLCEELEARRDKVAKKLYNIPQDYGPESLDCSWVRFKMYEQILQRIKFINEPLVSEGLNIDDYHIAPSNEGPLANTWKDKPHRLLYDLCGEVERLRARLDRSKKKSVYLEEKPPEKEQVCRTWRCHHDNPFCDHINITSQNPHMCQRCWRQR